MSFGSPSGAIIFPHAQVSQYRHNVGEDNADAHMKRQIMGREVWWWPSRAVAWISAPGNKFFTGSLPDGVKSGCW
jgi:hypothetical protein